MPLSPEHFLGMHTRIEKASNKEELLNIQSELRELFLKSHQDDDWMVESLLLSLKSKATKIVN